MSTIKSTENIHVRSLLTTTKRKKKKFNDWREEWTLFLGGWGKLKKCESNVESRQEGVEEWQKDTFRTWRPVNRVSSAPRSTRRTPRRSTVAPDSLKGTGFLCLPSDWVVATFGWGLVSCPVHACRHLEVPTWNTKTRRDSNTMLLSTSPEWYERAHGWRLQFWSNTMRASIHGRQTVHKEASSLLAARRQTASRRYRRRRRRRRRRW